MNKLFNKIAIASLSFAMSVGIGVALFHSDKTPVEAEAALSGESVTFSSQGYTNKEVITSYTGTNFAVYFNKNSNGNAPTYYTSGSAIRCYGANSFTIVATSTESLTKVVLTYGSSDGSNTITTDVGTFSTNTWTGNSDSVTFTIGGTTGNRRLSAMAITFGGASITNNDDTITRETTGSTGTPYVKWTHSSNASGAIYSGYTAGGNDSIQFNNNSSGYGIVTTASGGRAKSISVVFNSNTASGKTINVYGKSTAYSGPSDLYSSDTQGTLLGTIVYGTSTSYTFEGVYPYIGIRSNGGVIYATSVTFSWATPSTFTVSYDGNGSTSGTVPTDGKRYVTNSSVTVLGNTGNLTNPGYYFNGWNTKADGSGSSRAAGSTFQITGNTILYAQWAIDTLESISISGSMTMTSYNVGDLWDPSGFTVQATFGHSNNVDVTSQVTWSYNRYTTSTSVTSVVATASYTWEGVTQTASSSAQNVTVSAISSPYTLLPGTNGFADSNHTSTVSWVNNEHTMAAYLGEVAFEIQGSDNSGHYFTSNNSWRIYYNGEGGIKISVDPSAYEITSITIEFTPSKDSGATLNDESGNSLTSGTAWTPSENVWKQTFSVGVAGNIQITSITVATAPNQADPAVEITDTISSVDKGVEGTLHATKYNTTATIAWSSSDDSVLTIDNNGNYEGLAYGTVVVTAYVTVNNQVYSDTVTISVNGDTITVTEANAIAATYDSTKHTHSEYTVYITGYITQLESSSKAGTLDAIYISDGKIDSGESTIKVYGIYSNNPLRNYSILNGKITFVAKVCNYFGTHEITDTVVDDYTDDAIEYASRSYAALTSTCTSQGTEGITSEQWTALKTDWTNNVDSYSKAKLKAATSSYAYSEDIANWITRYTTIVEARSDLEDFMQLGITRKASNSLFALSPETSTSVMVVMSVIGGTALVGYFFSRKRRMINK